MAFDISSPAFKTEEFIPSRYSADGLDMSPALSWSCVPLETLSLALIVHDPDAPRSGGFTHWVIYNLPADSSGLPEGMPRKERLEKGVIQGKNDGGYAGYMGPAPPRGLLHHYHFTLYALDALLTLDQGVTRQDFLKAATGHILGQAELVGLYQR